jgi:hypothetical protein
MTDRPRHQAPVRRTLVVADFPGDTRHVLLRVDRLPGSAAPVKVSRGRLQAPLELALIVERGDHDVPPLPPVRVVSIVPYDEPADTVIPRIDPGHRTRLEPHVHRPGSRYLDRGRETGRTLSEGPSTGTLR